MISKKEKVMLYLTLLLGCFALVGLFNLTQVVIQDYKLYQAESACVSNYIRKNYSRNEIITGNGTCWIRGTEQ